MRPETSALVGLSACVLAAAAMKSAAADKPEVVVKEVPGGIEVAIDGELFTAYRFDFMGTPIFYPVIGPGGQNLTRHYPMVEGVEGEEKDHIHHRSIWFGHRDVNGESFWGAAAEDGKVKHLAVKKLEAGDGQAHILADNEMVTGEGTVIGSEEREYRIRALGQGEARLDYTVRIRADRGVDLHFANQKDGLMAIRVTPWLSYEDKKGKRGTGSIVNSEGIEGKDAWGKRADWVDYFGTAPDGKLYGVAMFDHPENLRHPTWWHARTYGLLSANPFGQGEFEKGEVPKEAGEYTVKKGEVLEFKYGFLFHRGDAAAAKVAEHYGRFAAGE